MITKILPSFMQSSLALGLVFAGANLASAQETVPDATLFYDFNTFVGDHTVKSSGSAEMDLEMYRYSGTAGGGLPWNMLGAAGSGVSGISGDRALNLSSATQMGGSSGQGGGAVGSGLSSIPDLNGAKSLTVAGWFNATESPLTTNAHLINAFPGSSDAGFRLAGLSGGKLQFSIVGESSRVNFDSNASYGAVGEWVFFAITFDNSAAGSAVVNFYVGGVDTAVTLASAVLTGNVGDFKAGDRPLTIGNVSAAEGSFGTNRPFQGYIDNVGIWGSGEDGSGALNLQQLDSLRQQQQQIPEPSMAAGLLGVVAVLACLKMRFNKKAK